MEIKRVRLNEFSCTLRPLLSGHPRDFEKWPLIIEVGRLTEVQYTLDKKGSKHDFIASI